MRKLGISLQTPAFLYIKVGFKGVYIQTCQPPENSMREIARNSDFLTK